MTKLAQMKLNGMSEAWQEQQANADTGQLSFDERFALLVDAEALHRENRRLTRYLREAKLKISNACIEDIDYTAVELTTRCVVDVFDASVAD
ncbi:MAG: ATP-binding protein, partial [Myxococcota bacterium]